MKNILLLCALFSMLCAKAQKFNVVHYSTAEGLSNSCVYGLYQDKKGFLWISTEFGLNRFDGNTGKSSKIDY